MSQRLVFAGAFVGIVLVLGACLMIADSRGRELREMRELRSRVANLEARPPTILIKVGKRTTPRAFEPLPEVRR